MSPFSNARGNKEFFIIAIGHFTKWVEAKAYASIIAQIVKDFSLNEVSLDSEYPLSSSLTTKNSLKHENFKRSAKSYI